MRKQQVTCDRCKKVFDESDIFYHTTKRYEMFVAEVKTEHGIFGMKERYYFTGLKNIDLCRKCNEELDRWFYEVAEHDSKRKV